MLLLTSTWLSISLAAMRAFTKRSPRSTTHHWILMPPELGIDVTSGPALRTRVGPDD